MYPISPRILLLLLFFTSLVAAAVNFRQCLEDFKADPSATGGVDSHGHDVSAADAVGLNYRTCTERCGSTAESFSWRQFVQSLVWWLFPWLAFLSRLPFGATNYIDDFFSVFMSVGSPALAAYSLMVTSFNIRMVYRKADRIAHEEKADVARALIVFQQTAVELTTDPRLLEFILVDSEWRHEILERLKINRGNLWSLRTGFSVASVIVAFIFTLIDSFVSLNDSDSSGSEGLAAGTIWLWLPCLVIGWLWVPSFSSEEINAALRRANIKAVRTAAKKLKEQADEVIFGREKSINTKFHWRQPPNPKASKKPENGPIVEAVDENEGVKQEPIYEGEIYTEEVVKLGSNSDLSLSVTSFLSPAELQGDHSDRSIGGIQTAQHSTASVVRSVEAPQPSAAISVASLRHEHDRLFNPKEEFGLLHTDEFRHPATFNYSRIMWYLVLVDDVFRALKELVIVDERRSSLSRSTEHTALERTFPPGVFRTMFKSVILALLLQIGITGAALVIIIFTPTAGFRCRSLGYTVYGGVSILIMFLTVISTILARISETRKDKSPLVRITTALFAIALRWTCYSLALVNSVGLVILFCFQFSNFLASCYCSSSVIGHGMNTYVIIVLQDWISTMRNARAIGIGVAASSISVFMISHVLISSPSRDLRGI